MPQTNQAVTEAGHDGQALNNDGGDSLSLPNGSGTAFTNPFLHKSDHSYQSEVLIHHFVQVLIDTA